MNRKIAIMDASSAIILCKAGLHRVFAECCKIIVPESVYGEITIAPHIGSDEYKRSVAEKQVMVQWQGCETERMRSDAGGLDIGEYDVICLYYTGEGDFVVTDDGAAAKYCIKREIPFINALLVPVVLRFSGVFDEQTCRRSMDEVMRYGRYSSKVTAFASRCCEKDIDFALPGD